MGELRRTKNRNECEVEIRNQWGGSQERPIERASVVPRTWGGLKCPENMYALRQKSMVGCKDETACAIAAILWGGAAISEGS